MASRLAPLPNCLKRLKALQGRLMRNLPVSDDPKIKKQLCEAEKLLSPSNFGGNVLFMFSYSEKKQAKSDIGPVNAEEAFKLNLSDLPDWFLEASCCYSKAAGLAWFERRCGDQKLGDFVCRLTCSHCGERPKYVHIQDAPYYQPGVAGNRRLILLGSEASHWGRHAGMRAAAKGQAART